MFQNDGPPLPCDFLKLNVDAFWTKSQNKGAIGGLMRDHFSSFMSGFSFSFFSLGVEARECKAIKDGLGFIRANG